MVMWKMRRMMNMTFQLKSNDEFVEEEDLSENNDFAYK
jgi:hypothetical protein